MGIISRKALDAVKITDFLEENAEFYFKRSGKELVTVETEQGDSISINRRGLQAQLSEGMSQKSTYRTKARSTASPYDSYFRIVEFGTGAYASPQKRTSDDGRNTKVGSKGHWIFGPLRGDKRIGPEVVGQKGMHFLIRTRDNVQLMKKYDDIITDSIRESLRDIFGKATTRRKG